MFLYEAISTGKFEFKNRIYVFVNKDMSSWFQLTFAISLWIDCFVIYFMHVLLISVVCLKDILNYNGISLGNCVG